MLNIQWRSLRTPADNLLYPPSFTTIIYSYIHIKPYFEVIHEDRTALLDKMLTFSLVKLWYSGLQISYRISRNNINNENHKYCRMKKKVAFNDFLR